MVTSSSGLTAWSPAASSAVNTPAFSGATRALAAGNTRLGFAQGVQRRPPLTRLGAQLRNPEPQGELLLVTAPANGLPFELIGGSGRGDLAVGEPQLGRSDGGADGIALVAAVSESVEGGQRSRSVAGFLLLQRPGEGERRVFQAPGRNRDAGKDRRFHDRRRDHATDRLGVSGDERRGFGESRSRLALAPRPAGRARARSRRCPAVRGCRGPQPRRDGRQARQRCRRGRRSPHRWRPPGSSLAARVSSACASAAIPIASIVLAAATRTGPAHARRRVGGLGHLRPQLLGQHGSGRIGNAELIVADRGVGKLVGIVAVGNVQRESGGGCPQIDGVRAQFEHEAHERGEQDVAGRRPTDGNPGVLPAGETRRADQQELLGDRVLGRHGATGAVELEGDPLRHGGLHGRRARRRPGLDRPAGRVAAERERLVGGQAAGSRSSLGLDAGSWRGRACRHPTLRARRRHRTRPRPGPRAGTRRRLRPGRP